MTLYLFRHAEVEERYQGRYRGGQLDCDLSPKGKQNSASIAHFLVEKQVQIVVTSHLQRTRYVGVLAAQQGIKHVIEKRLREIDMGAWDGKPGIPEEEFYPKLVAEELFPEGETLSNVIKRAGTAWEEITRQHFKSVAIIGHSITNRALLSLLLSKDFMAVRGPRKSHYHELKITPEAAEMVQENVSVIS